jgi:hypothetical protein
MSTVTPDELDEVAANLAKAYQRVGVFCVIVRNVGTDGKVRAICPQREVTQISEFLRHTAEVLFNGPGTVRYPSAGS